MLAKRSELATKINKCGHPKGNDLPMMAFWTSQLVMSSGRSGFWVNDGISRAAPLLRKLTINMSSEQDVSHVSAS